MNVNVDIGEAKRTCSKNTVFGNEIAHLLISNISEELYFCAESCSQEKW
jgi:hypothetical protein